MRIALDVMGGDLAPSVNLSGAAMALQDFSSLNKLFLVGAEEVIRSSAAEHDLNLSDPRVEIVHAPEVVEMSEAGARAVRRKRRSSISIATDLVKQGEADAVVSAGNTGACVAAAQLKLRMIPGVRRAGISAGIPNDTGVCHLLDAGANPQAKPAHLLGYAVMGSAFAHGVYGVKRPKVGIMSNGEEDAKGTSFTQETFRLIQEFTENKVVPFEFVGNVEGRDLFEAGLDVCLCDGFVGNIVLKTAEATAKAMTVWLRNELEAKVLRKIGAILSQRAYRELKDKMSSENQGGSPLLGVNGVVIVAHGSSSALAMKNAIRVGLETYEGNVNQYIREAFAQAE